jgi:hypothetical protein
MDGSALVYGSLRVYNSGEESGSTTEVAGKDSSRVSHVLLPYQIGDSKDLKPRRGGRVSDLIKAFEKPTKVYDPGTDSRPAPLLAMSVTGGGANQGGSGEDPTRLKPSAEGRLVLDSGDRQLAMVVADDLLDDNWHGVAEEGGSDGPEAMLEGEVNLEDEFCMKEEAEDEVPPARPKKPICITNVFTKKE